MRNIVKHIGSWFNPQTIKYGFLMFLIAIIGLIITFEDRHGSQPTPTASSTPTTVSSVTPSDQPQEQVNLLPEMQMPIVFPVTMVRSSDTVGLCIASSVEPHQITLNFYEVNEYYTLEEIVTTLSSATGSCWCLQQPERVFPIPSFCTDQNTFIPPSHVGDWRNATIRISIGDIVRECIARPANREIYECEF